MRNIGRTEGAPGSAGINRDRWVNLIDSHPALSRVPSRIGMNPFTRQPTEFKAAATSAVVSVSGTAVGAICWAQDGSQMLYVDAREDSADAVARVAEEVATSLGGRFLLEAE